MHLTLLISLGNSWVSSHPSSHTTSYFMKWFVQCPDFLLNYISFRITCFLYTLIQVNHHFSFHKGFSNFCFALEQRKDFQASPFCLFQYRHFLVTQIQPLSHFKSSLNLLQTNIFETIYFKQYI